MKKQLLLLGVIPVCLAIIGYGTIAYFSAEKIAHNIITTGGIDISIIEKTEGTEGALVEFPQEGLSGVMPGSCASKIVSVQNTGAEAAWIRVKVIQELVAADGSPLPGLLDGDIPVMTFEVDSSKWTQEDGWYYYNADVSPGAITEVLFDKVKFAPEMGNAYQGCKANLSVYAQAVQTANNGTSATEAAGWPTEVID